MTPLDPAPAWRRVHKVTPLLNAWKAVLAALAVVLWQAGEQVQGMPAEIWDAVTGYRTTALLITLGGLVLVTGLATGYAFLAWSRMRFAVTEESVDLHTGVLFRQQRHARLNRVQAVDIVQPLLGRVFGLAQVRVETAGGNDSNVVIGYLREPEAQELRREILTLASGVGRRRPSGEPRSAPAPVGQDTTAVVSEGGDALVAPESAADVAPSVSGPTGPRVAEEERILEVPPGRLVASLLLSGWPLALVLVLAGVVVTVVLAGSVAPVFGLLPVVLGTVGYVWNRFAGEFGFRSAVSEDGIVLRHGLLETRSQTLPPGRVQAVELIQPLLWRRAGWWRVRVNVAGYAQTSSSGAAVETVLLPVGPRGEALTSLWLVLPDLGADDVPALLDAALTGSGPDAGFLTCPPQARWLDPWTYRRTGLRITGTAMVIRRGRFVRRVVVVPHERTQSLALEHGPLQRRLRLASLQAHSVPGPVSAVVPHLDGARAREVLTEQAGRARTARAAEGPEEWLRRVSAGVADGG